MRKLNPHTKDEKQIKVCVRVFYRTTILHPQPTLEHNSKNKQKIKITNLLWALAQTLSAAHSIHKAFASFAKHLHKSKRVGVIPLEPSARGALIISAPSDGSTKVLRQVYFGPPTYF
jgi:hypothetical protein